MHHLFDRFPVSHRVLLRVVTLSLLLAGAGLTGCEDIDSPAELDHAQVLAVSANPAQVPAGGTSALDVLVAGPDGDIAPSALQWTVSAPGVPSGLGDVVFDDSADDESTSGWRYRAPETLPGEPVMLTLAVEIEVPSGPDGEGVQILAAEKVLMVGMDSLSSPEIAALAVDGVAIAERMALRSGDRVELSLDLISATPGGLTTWHATCGILEQYRESIAIFEAPAEPCYGVLYAVHRDDAGGVAWLEVEIAVSGE